MDPSKAKVPPMKDLTIGNITENTIRINSQSSDPRLTYVLDRLVTHLHDFARETRLSTKEWMAAINYLTAVGQICSDVRQVRSISPNWRSLNQLSEGVVVRAFGQGYIVHNERWQAECSAIDWYKQSHLYVCLDNTV